MYKGDVWAFCTFEDRKVNISWTGSFLPKLLSQDKKSNKYEVFGPLSTSKKNLLAQRELKNQSLGLYRDVGHTPLDLNWQTFFSMEI